MVKFRNHTRGLCRACDLATGFSGKKISGHLSHWSFAEKSWRPYSVIYTRYRRVTLRSSYSSACSWPLPTESPHQCVATLEHLKVSPRWPLLPKSGSTRSAWTPSWSAVAISACLACTYLWFLIWADPLWSISCPDKLRLKCKPRWIWQSWPVHIPVDSALAVYDCLRITDRNNDSIYFKDEKSLGKIANDIFRYLTGPKSSSC